MTSSSAAPQGRRDIGLDLLKVAMAFLVVAIHAGMLTDLEGSLGMWPQYVLLQGIARIAVPVFLVITGFYFAGSMQRNGLHRWLHRGLVLYLVWMALYAPLWLPEAKGPEGVLHDLWFGWFHLWYLAAMLKAGIALYLLRNAPVRILLPLSLALIAAGWWLQLQMMLGALPHNDDLTRNALFVAFPFMALGLCLGRYREALPRLRAPLRLALAGAVLVMALEIALNGLLIGTDVGLDTLLSLVLVCPLLVATVAGAGFEGQMRRLAGFATAVYLIHPAILKLIGYLGDTTPTVTGLLVAALASLAAIALLSINRKVTIL